MALPFALFSLALVGAFVGAAFWLGIAERRAGVASLALQEAFSEAEKAVQEAVAGWDAARFNRLAVSGETSDTAWQLDTGVRSVTNVQRVSQTLFLVTGVGRSRTELATQRIGSLVQLRPPSLALREALAAAGPISLGAQAAVSVGTGEADECGSSQGNEGREGGQESDGTGYEPLEKWAAWAAKTVAPGRRSRIGPSVEGSVCSIADRENWGEPRDPVSPCGNYLPIVHVPGDLDVIGGVGQGVLVVTGDLILRGGFHYEGLVLVGGRMTVSGAGATINGAAQIGNAEHGALTVRGQLRIEYSPCVLRRVLAGSALAVPLPRGWLNAY